MARGRMNITLSAAGMSGRLRQRSGFAVQHLMAAARFSRQCGEIQLANEGKQLGPFFDELISCVSATVMLSVASLESNINEHLSDSERLFAELPDGGREQLCALMGDLPILHKYQRTLAAKGLEAFDRGGRPYQDIDILVAIRNELVHFHPEWHDEQDRHEKLGKRLLYRFPLNPFISESSGVVFPQRFIGHGCTKWAVESALSFMTIFAEKIGQPNRFEKHAERLHA